MFKTTENAEKSLVAAGFSLRKNEERNLKVAATIISVVKNNYHDNICG